MKNSKNPNPFRLLGFEYEDFEAWCEHRCVSEKSRDSKKKFFREALDYSIKKKNGKIIYVEEGDES